MADVTAAYKGVGATRTEQLFLDRNEAITENDRQIKQLTLDVVTLAREVNAAGGSAAGSANGTQFAGDGDARARLAGGVGKSALVAILVVSVTTTLLAGRFRRRLLAVGPPPLDAARGSSEDLRGMSLPLPGLGSPRGGCVRRSGES